MDMILKTTDLCKNFKGQAAVNNVSLNIQRNSVYGLLGPNILQTAPAMNMEQDVQQLMPWNVQLNE